jgi:hypothetical protein
MRKERQLAGSTRRKSFLPKPFAGTGGLIVEGKRQCRTATNAATKNLGFLTS